MTTYIFASKVAPVSNAATYRSLVSTNMLAGWRADFSFADPLISALLYAFNIAAVEVTTTAPAATVQAHYANAIGMEAVMMGYTGESGSDYDTTLTTQTLAPLEQWVQGIIPNFTSGGAGIIAGVDSKETALPKAVQYIIYLIQTGNTGLELSLEQIDILEAAGLSASQE